MKTVSVADGAPLIDYAYMVPNGTQLAGGQRGRARYMASLKAQGLKVGVSDLVIAYPSGGYHGAYIELKKNRELYPGPAAVRSAIRPEQVAWLDRMRGVGYWVAVAYGLDEFKESVREYLSGGDCPELA